MLSNEKNLYTHTFDTIPKSQNQTEKSQHLKFYSVSKFK